MKYQKEYIINKDISISNIINNFLNTSNDESKRINLDNNKLISLGYTWMIYKWRINIIRKPRDREKVIVSTWASGFKNLYAYREFDMKSDGGLIAKASVVFILIDLEKRKPIKIPDDIMDYYTCDEEKNFENIERINIKDDFEKINSYFYETRKNDIDENNHVNNLVYIDLMKESLPDEYKNIDIKNLSIHYMNEIKFGDSIKIDVYKENDKIFFDFKASDESHKHARAWISSN